MSLYLESRKRKHNDGPKVVYSQPARTGGGAMAQTQLTLAIAYLKSKTTALTFNDIIDYLSLQSMDESETAIFRTYLQNTPSVFYDAKGAEGKGTYRYKPPFNVYSADDLINLLQGQSTAQGIQVKLLKDGWPNATKEINRLSDEGRVLVTRNKKDDSPRYVWPNDRTLNLEVDPDFKGLWTEVKMPKTQDDLRKALENLGLTPTSVAKAPIATGPEKKKKRAQRKGGKTTNTHMLGILQDFSHLRRA